MEPIYDDFTFKDFFEIVSGYDLYTLRKELGSGELRRMFFSAFFNLFKIFSFLPFNS